MSIKITDKKTIEAILKEAKYLRLGLCSGSKPYIVPMCYGYKDGVIYMHSGKKGTKIDIIKMNPDACFEADILYETLKSDNPCVYNMKYQSIVGFGKAFILENEDEIKEGLKVIIAHYHNKDYNIDDLNISGLAVIKIAIESMQARQNKME